MIAIEDKLISEEVLGYHFLCDLDNCKGACCEEGDAGAPLTDEECKEIERVFSTIKPLLTAASKEEIKKQGMFVRYDDGWATPTIGEGICVYGVRDSNGCIGCAFQMAYQNQQTAWEKPISCHLFPIITRQTKLNEIINFEPRPMLCKSGCQLGEKHKVKVYQFLKIPLIRKYGQAFYDALKAVDAQFFSK